MLYWVPGLATQSSLSAIHTCTHGMQLGLLPGGSGLPRQVVRRKGQIKEKEGCEAECYPGQCLKFAEWFSDLDLGYLQ